MAFPVQRTLEFAGALSKVQPQLQRLHLVSKPKKRHRLRNVVLVGSVIAFGAVAAGVVFRRRGCCGSALAVNGGAAHASFPEQGTPDVDPDREHPASDPGQQDFGATDPG